MAGGYNSYHEAIAFALPTLFIPNLNTGMDDQLARVKAGEANGACKVLSEQAESTFKKTLDAFMVPSHRENMMQNCKSLETESGAVEAAKYLLTALR
jgi:UDP-N-acetylglucosamine:LPS N-acetylglucosamine transferase